MFICAGTVAERYALFREPDFWRGVRDKNGDCVRPGYASDAYIQGVSCALYVRNYNALVERLGLGGMKVPR
jgi:hypothetical protein